MRRGKDSLEREGGMRRGSLNDEKGGEITWNSEKRQDVLVLWNCEGGERIAVADC